MIRMKLRNQQLHGHIVPQSGQHIQCGRKQPADGIALVRDLIEDHIARNIRVDNESLTEQHEGRRRLYALRCGGIAPEHLRQDSLEGK